MSRKLYGNHEVKGTITAEGLIIEGAFTLPTVDGTSGQILVTDGAGNVSWQNPSFVTPVDSVNGQTGNVVLDTDDISEGSSNLYWTIARFNSAFAGKDTDGLSEGGSNLYFTNERVDDRTAALIQNGTGISWAYNDVAGTLTPTITLTPFSTTDLSEGSNLYFTDERVDDRVAALIQDGKGLSWTYDDGLNTFTGEVSLTPFNTNDLSEGVTNLYYTQARFDADFILKSIGELSDVDLTGSPGPQEGDSLRYIGGIWTYSTPVDADELSKVSANDTTAGYLFNKITGSSNKIDITEVNDGGNETLNINIGSDVFDKTSDTTDNITEGSSNLFFTNERVDDRVAALIIDGLGTTWTYDDGANTLKVDVSLSPFSIGELSDVLLGSALATGDALIWQGSDFQPQEIALSVNGQSGIVVLDSDDVSEGATNLYLKPDEKKSIIDEISTGLKTGGDITQTGPLTITVDSGTGVINDGGVITEVNWLTQTGITIPISSISFVTIDATGTVNISGTADSFSEIVLATIYTNGTQIISIAIGHRHIDETVARTHIYSGEVIGNISVFGLLVTAVGSPALSFEVTGGVYYLKSDRKQVLDSGGIATFTYWYRDGSGGWITVPGNVTIDSTQYDDGSGTLASLAPGKFKKETVFVVYQGKDSPIETPEYHVIYGQTVYDSEEDAETDTLQIPPTYLLEWGLRTASLINNGGQISKVLDERPFIGQQSTGIAVNPTNHGNLLGLLDDDHPQYHTDGRALTWLQNDASTDDLSEGITNLYFTNERVDDRVAALIQDSATITWTYDDGSNTLTPAVNDNTSTQRIEVSKGAGAVGTRKELNFIEGAGISLSISDNSGDDRIDLIISASIDEFIALDDLTDVDTTTTPPTSGDVLTYGGSPGEWTPQRPRRTWSWAASLNGNSITNSYLRAGGNSFTNQSSFRCAFACKITAISIQTDGNETWTGEIRKNGVAAPIASLSASASSGESNDGLSVSLSANDVVEFYCNGTNISNPFITIWLEEE